EVVCAGCACDCPGVAAGCCAQLAAPNAAIKAITERAVLRSFLLMVTFLRCAIGHWGRTIELRASMSQLVSDSNATTEIEVVLQKIVDDDLARDRIVIDRQNVRWSDTTHSVVQRYRRVSPIHGDK